MIKLEGLSKVFDSLGKLKAWTVIIIFVAFMGYVFKDDISTLITRPQSTPDIVEQGITNNKLVNDVLSQMMYEFKGDRAYVYRFHNGVNYYDGNHKIKSSMDFEVTANGIQTIGLFMQDIPTSLFADRMARIINEEVLGLSLEETEDKAAAAVMVEFGVTHSSVLPFYDTRGKLVMVIGLDWVNKEAINFDSLRFKTYVEKIGKMLTGQPSRNVSNILDRNLYRTRGVEDGLPDYVLEYESRVSAPRIDVGLKTEYIKLRKAEILALITSAK